MIPTSTRSTLPAYPAEYSTSSRIHWGAVIAGGLLAVATSFALNLLGVGIGLSTIDPATEARPFAGLGAGAIIWYVIANLAALFAGGYVAGRLCGFPKVSTSGLHGLLAWALFTLLSLYILNSAVGKVFNLVGSTISTVASATGQAVGAAVPDDLGQRITQELRDSDINLNSIRDEVYQLLEDTDKEALDPQNLEREAGQVADAAKNDAERAAKNPYAANREVNDVIDRISRRGDNVINAADQDALVNVIVARTDMNEAEARRAVQGYSQKFEQAKASARQKLNQLGDTAVQVGDDVADALATAAILGFLGLLAGAGAAFFAGTLGRQQDLTLIGGESINAADVDAEGRRL